MNGVTVHIDAPRVNVRLAAPRMTVSLGSPMIATEPYTGSYEITPSGVGQTLDTDGKLMTGDVIVHGVSAYSGSYSVTPSASSQTLDTDGKLMTDDVTVAAVALPYADVSSVDASAADVRQGKKIVGANGQQITGTNEGFVIVPDGYAYYNGILLPTIPEADDYDYTFIRKNNSTGNYDCVQGKSQWRARTQSTLDNWQLEFTNMTTIGTRQYSISQDGSATSWGEATISTASYYGTAQDRKVVWSNEDIMIASTGNVLLRGSSAVGG